MLDGVETAEGIFINTEAKNPVKWAATHEFSNTIKKNATETWEKEPLGDVHFLVSLLTEQ